MQDIISLEELSSITVNVDNVKYTVFDISKASFRNINVFLYEYIVSIEEQSRMDLISNNLYNTTDNEDVLMFINNIKNSFKIKKDTIILYPEARYIDSFRDRIDKGEELRTVISENRNKKRIDAKRILSTKNLPPTITESDYNPISIVDGILVIGKGILNV